jgi:CDP-6-deoxy-D-xylo-4-hexulose-3-dehydrase
VGAVPVFIDADTITGNACCDQLEAAYSPGKTKAVRMAHALGNPFDLAITLSFCRKYDLWLVEDNCDALGCSYSMPRPLAESLGFTENSPGLDEAPRAGGALDRHLGRHQHPELLPPPITAPWVRAAR